MRCIEIKIMQDRAACIIRININMRCIEIITKQDIFDMYPRLTLT